MSFAAYYKLSSYCLVASGFLAVATTGALGPLSLGVLSSVLIAGWFIDTVRLRRALPPWAWAGILLAYVPVYYFDWRFLSRSTMTSTLHLVLFIAAFKLLTRATDRDYLYLYLLSFCALLATTTLTIDLGFLFCLFLFLTSAISALVLYEMKRSGARATKGAVIQPVVVPRSLRGSGFELFSGFPSGAVALLTLSLVVLIVALAVPLFLLLPRVSLGVSHRSFGRPRLISGFSETVKLGAIGTIKESNALVMKVKVDAPPAKLPPDLKWRGIALDHFDGKSWSCGRTDRNQIPTQAGYFKLQEYTQGTDILVQTFFLEPISTDVVFGSHKVLAVSGDLGWLERDASDNIYTLTQRTSALRYSVVSDITRPDPKLIASVPGRLPRDVEACCLQVPEEDPRVAALARGVTAAAATPYDKALALERYLRNSYGYSLELKGTPESADPLATFLFSVRRGHCEYFATAMAAMLRQLGIPSRLINGFRAGEYNSLSNHWTVREYNAHSWVEAYFSPYGWVEFDPTPAEPEPQAPVFLKTIANLFDSLDLWWSDNVVDYDLRKQSLLVQTGQTLIYSLQSGAWEYVRRAGRGVDAWLGKLYLHPQIVSPAGLVVSLTAVLLLTAIMFFKPSIGLLQRLLHFIGPTRSRHDSGTTIVGLYVEALDLLKSRGWERRRSQTPLEFTRDLAQEPFGNVLFSLTALYNRVRFGRAVGQSDVSQVRELLRSLRVMRHSSGGKEQANQSREMRRNR
jgi:uncharacterized membrane protein